MTCVCDFLLVRHSNLGPILHRFRDIAGFLHPTPISPEFWGGPDRRCWGQSEHLLFCLSAVKLFSKYSAYVITVPERHGRTDRRTDGILWHNRTLCSIVR